MTTNLKDLWISILKHLSQQLDRAQLITWFKQTAPLSLEEGKLHIGLPYPIFLRWHQDQFAPPTLQAAQKIDSSITKLSYEVVPSFAQNDPRTVDILKHFPQKNESRKLPNKNQVKNKQTGTISKMINPRYTLENFITSAENRLAHAACQNVARYPSENYNPLFIYGDVGLGKTHLLQAIGNEMLKNDPSKLIMYMTTETFVNDVVSSIQKRDMESFRKRYRSVDAFIIDDVQFMANKDRSQEEFFHTFNTLYELGSQIVLSSDRPPHELSLLNPRLVSRFESGMIVDVKMPEYETRLAILNLKCKEAQIFINQEVLEFIAHNVTSSVRALEGVMKQAMAQYELEQKAPTVKSIAEMMHWNHGKEEKKIGFDSLEEYENSKAVTLERLIEFVTHYYTVSRDDLESSSRLREFMVPRQVIMYLAKTKLRIPLSRIGAALGNRNHTTVIHSVKRVEKDLKNNRQLLRDVNAIVQEVGLR